MISKTGYQLRRGAAAAFLSTMALVAAQPAAAQDEGRPGAAGGDAAEIVVTGTRIARRDYDSNSPIVTATERDFKLTASGTPESFLNTLPQLAPDAGASSTDQRRDGGGTHLNLRGLGPQRNLVLLDGRRLIAANSSGYVDVSIIPTSIVDRVEVITGGASAVYGADAVAGVVNLVLREQQEGLRVNGQYGITERGDTPEVTLGASLGGKFADGRGTALIAYDYYDRKGITFADRRFSRPSEYATTTTWGAYNPVGNAPSQGAVDALFADYGFAPGSVLATDQLGINDDRSLFSVSVSALAPPVTNFRGSLSDPELAGHFLPGRLAYQYSDQTGLVTPLKRHNFFGNVRYELSDRISAFGRFLYSSQTTLVLQGKSAGANSLQGSSFDIPVTNPFIPDDLRALLASRSDPTAPFRYQTRIASLGPREEYHDTDVYQLSGGLNGAFGNGLKWEVYASHGVSKTDTRRENAGQFSVISRLLNAPDGGASECAGGLNFFTRTRQSDECIALINPTSIVRTKLETTVLEGSLVGKIVTLPAGDVGFAIGAQHRRERYDFTPDTLVANGDLGGFPKSPAVSGRFTNNDVYGEVRVPLLAGIPMIDELALSGGYRYSDHSVVGSFSSYKIDAEWAPVKALRFRGSYQRAVRAPNIQELFTPIGYSNVVVTDPCNVNSAQRTGPSASQVRALCLAQGVPASIIDTYTQPTTAIIATTGGNLDLKEETADTYTVGFVLSSPAASGPLSRLRLSVDYYRIKLRDAIGSLRATNYIPNCFNAQGANPTFSADNAFCQLFQRRSDGAIVDAVQNSINVASLEVSGIDAQMTWSIPLSDRLGTLSFDLNVGWLDKYRRKDSPADPNLNFAGTIGQYMGDTLPEWKGALTTSYSLEPMTLIGRLRYIGKMDNRVNVVTPGSGTGVPATWYFDLSAFVDVTDQTQLRFGVVNLFDQQPRLYTPQQQARTDPSTYDVLGRRFTIGFTTRF